MLFVTWFPIISELATNNVGFATGTLLPKFYVSSGFFMVKPAVTRKMLHEHVFLNRSDGFPAIE